MCGATKSESAQEQVPVPAVLQPPTMLARYTCASVFAAIFGVFIRYTFVPEDETPGVDVPIHSYKVPLALTVGYLVSLPILKALTERFLVVDSKLLLKESMVLYNAGQVLINAWMVYRFVDAVLFRGHPFVGDMYSTGTITYAVWVHYCDKYLEFFDTYFMVFRGRMDQVSFLHVYHHTSIAWAWWVALKFWPGGDAYFGALFNSLIHVVMYSYYTLSLLKVSCPWKRHLTKAQLFQFVSVIVYTITSFAMLWKEALPQHYFGWSVQFIEMASMFVLFARFYKKAYKAKKKELEQTKTDSNDSATDQASVSSASTEHDE